MDDWGKVVTRYPYGNVGMDHLLSREKHTIKCDQLGSMNVLFSFERLCSTLEKKVFEKWIILIKEKLRNKERRVNALALGADEGRDEQRYASVSRK